MARYYRKRGGGYADGTTAWMEHRREGCADRVYSVRQDKMKSLDAQGKPYDAPSQTYSVSPAGKKRADLVCNSVQLPPGWDDNDPTKGFGPLNIVIVN